MLFHRHKDKRREQERKRIYASLLTSEKNPFIFGNIQNENPIFFDLGFPSDFYLLLNFAPIK